MALKFAEIFGIEPNNNWIEAFKIITEGQGSEIRKINSLISSSLLSLLTFHKLFRNNNPGLCLEVKLPDNEKTVKFDQCFFEFRNKVISLPSCVDVALYSTESNILLFLESKFTEIFSTCEKALYGKGYIDLYTNKHLIDTLSSRLKIGRNKSKGKEMLSLEVNGNGKHYIEGIKQSVSHLIGLVKGPAKSGQGYYPEEYYADYRKLYNNARELYYGTILFELCLELEDRGLRVPKDMLLCTLNYSTNSIVFRPMLTGADRMDEEAVKAACDLLEDMMAGKAVNRENFYECKMHYGTSCGCDEYEEAVYGKRYQELILAKVEAATQVSGMMQYNNALEKVDSLDQLADNLKGMLQGISCSGFFCCLNQSDLRYIVNEESERRTEQNRIYDRTMVAVTGVSDRTGTLKNAVFPVEELFPAGAEEGDILIFLPVHYKEQDFGYMVFLNEYFPIEIYNYRICHECIGSSIENLRRQMIMQSNIQKLDELHMKDQMTGLYNRFGLQRFRDDYTSGNEFTVVMIVACRCLPQQFRR